MATLTRKKSGCWEIQFLDLHKRRRSISLGKRFTEDTANELLKTVERLIHFRDNSLPVDKRTLFWLETTTPEIRNKLAAVGLVTVAKQHTCQELWDTFLAEKITEVKTSTMKTYTDAKQRFFEVFDPNEQIADLTKQRMQEWKNKLRQEMAEATSAGTLAKVKAAFNWAVRNEWLEKSPLVGVGRGSFRNRAKDRYITMEEYEQLLDTSPCQDWRVIIALARIGGLRCPSEVLRLRWSDVNWEKSRFYVRSPKTEHHEGKGGRVVPLFPRLRDELGRLFEMELSEGSEFVITRYRDPERTNLGTQFGRIVQMAGIEPIKKPFTNMRASRSTEIYSEFGPFLESKWIGHSTKTARDHYLQVREIDFALAVRDDRQKDQRNGDFSVNLEDAFCEG